MRGGWHLIAKSGAKSVWTDYVWNMEFVGALLLFVLIAIGGIAVAIRSVPLWIAALDEDEADDN
jgi:hypothetical protein